MALLVGGFVFGCCVVGRAILVVIGPAGFSAAPRVTRSKGVAASDEAAGARFIRIRFANGSRFMRVEMEAVDGGGKLFYRGRTWNETRRRWSGYPRKVYESEVVDPSPEVNEARFVSKMPWMEEAKNGSRRR